MRYQQNDFHEMDGPLGKIHESALSLHLVGYTVIGENLARAHTAIQAHIIQIESERDELLARHCRAGRQSR